MAVGVLNLAEAWSRDQSGRDFGLQVIQAALWFIAGCLFLWPKTVKFYEKGIQLPRNADNRLLHARFLPWSQVERYHWEGDALYFARTESILKTGGIAVLGEPWAIQPRNRLEAEAILARYVESS
jgi:hypothetical protein